MMSSMKVLEPLKQKVVADTHFLFTGHTWRNRTLIKNIRHLWALHFKFQE